MLQYWNEKFLQEERSSLKKNFLTYYSAKKMTK